MQAPISTGADEESEPELPSEPTPHQLDALASLLERLVERNNSLLLVEENRAATRLDAFCAARPPGIRIGRYLERIYRFTRCSPACFVAAFVYVDRAVFRNPGALLVSLNVHRLLLASILVASKVLEDVHYDNAFYARVGGVSNEELNRLELELLFLLDFGVTVSSTVFEIYSMHLEKEMMFKDVAAKVNRSVPDSSRQNQIKVLHDQNHIIH